MPQSLLAPPQVKTVALASRNRYGAELLALYGAFGLIAAIVFGTLFTSSF
ncbi:MAG: hypothetical protein K2X60_07315 [Xanthobacteraceae bacterium]|nr:hypothetical protein [Xanthobacteraceae bacterium]